MKALIQSALIFVLGFLAASFLAILVAPVIWRRAVLLTRRRLEAALPLSMAEISADKDAVRAQYAMMARRLEMTIKTLRQENIAQSLLIERTQGETREAVRSYDAAELARTEVEKHRQQLEQELQKATAEAERLAEELAGRDQVLAEQAAELKSLGAMYDEASFTASDRQIELVAQEANIDKMNEEVASLTARQRQMQAQLRDAAVKISEQEQALSAEKRKGAALELKNSKLIASLSDVQEKLERRERDLQSLRGRQQAGVAEDDVADMALLRERIKDLAAEMVSLTAQVEGPDSEIHKVLAKASETASPMAGSLAGRIRALQEEVEAAQKGKA